MPRLRRVVQEDDGVVARTKHDVEGRIAEHLGAEYGVFAQILLLQPKETRILLLQNMSHISVTHVRYFYCASSLPVFPLHAQSRYCTDPVESAGLYSAVFKNERMLHLIGN